MAATSTILFPEPFFPSAYSAEPLAGQLAVGDADNGAEQVAERRSYPLMKFSWRSPELTVAEAATFRTFIDQCGSGFRNFTFYEPFSEKFETLQVATTDGTNQQFIVPFRKVNSYTDLLVDGSPDPGSFSAEFVSPTKEDQLTLSTVYAADKPVTVVNAYARRRYICRMLTWRRYPFADGQAGALEFDPASTDIPLHYMVYEFTFREKR